MEQEIAEIVEEVLGRRVAPDQDLFDQGATSLAFVRIVALVNQRYDTALTGSELGDLASVDTLAAAVRTAQKLVPTSHRSPS